MAHVAEGFRLEAGGVATPGRVAAAAAFVERLLHAASPAPSGEGPTLTVPAGPLTLIVRAQSADAQRAVERILALLEAPEPSLDQDPAARRIAAALAQPGPELVCAVIRRSGERRPAATLDGEFQRKMSALAASEPKEVSPKGSTIVYSPVLRVGRSGAETVLKVRLELDGAPLEVALADERSASDFRKAAKEKRAFPVHLQATWARGPDGALHLDASETVATAVDLSWTRSRAEEMEAAKEDLRRLEGRVLSDKGKGWAGR